MVTVTVLTNPTAPETGMTVNGAEVGVDLPAGAVDSSAPVGRSVWVCLGRVDALWVMAGAALCWGGEVAGVCCGEVSELESAADTEDAGEKVTDGAKLMDDNKIVGAVETVAVVVAWLVVASGERGVDVATAGLAPPWFVVGSKVV
jgi:hypothetical protein